MPVRQPFAAFPNKTFPFSGRMIDAATRTNSRFPPDKVPIAAAEISKTLDQMRAGRADLAICGGACGGDLLFAEAALARNLMLEMYIPFGEEEFLGKSVDFADADWRARFFGLKGRKPCWKLRLSVRLEDFLQMRI